MGILASLVAALTFSIQNSQFRHLSSVNTNLINWFKFGFAIVALGALVTVFGAWSFPPLQFWLLLVALTLPLEALFQYCWVKSFQLSPQSLVGPLLALSSVFVIPIAFFLLDEVPSGMGLAGVSFVVLGALTLGWGGKMSIRSVFSKIFKEKGSYYMLVVAIVASVVVPIGKLMLMYVSPVLLAFYVMVGLFITHTPLAIRAIRNGETMSGRYKELLAAGAVFAVSVVFHYIALSLILVTYFISIKRLSIVFDVILGRFIHKEKETIQRLLASIVMVSGVALIAFSAI